MPRFRRTRAQVLAPPAALAAPRQRRGQSLVELSLALPFLLLIMLGTIDLGRMFFDYIQIRNAAMEGAQYGSRNPTDTAGMVTQTTNHGVPTGTTVSASCSGDRCTSITGGAGTVTVTATRTFTPVTTAFLQNWFGIQPFTMSASASTRVMS